LAVGVNLPCHLVIIKNTVGWQHDGPKEYTDLEMMQMLGRAGRYLLLLFLRPASC
jgi:ATP-dependent DNA helicase HFM1/MER3